MADESGRQAKKARLAARPSLPISLTVQIDQFALGMHVNKWVGECRAILLRNKSRQDTLITILTKKQSWHPDGRSARHGRFRVGHENSNTIIRHVVVAWLLVRQGSRLSSGRGHSGPVTSTAQQPCHRVQRARLIDQTSFVLERHTRPCFNPLGATPGSCRIIRPMHLFLTLGLFSKNGPHPLCC